MIKVISIAWFWGIFLEVFILKSGISCISFINVFEVFFSNCITTGEGLEGVDIYMIILAPDEYGDDEKLEDSKEDHEQAEQKPDIQDC